MRLPLKVRLTRLSFCCSGETTIGGEIVALAVKVIHITSPQIAKLAEQEVRALLAVRGKEHILQYVHHTLTASKQTLLLSTRCVTLLVHCDSSDRCLAPQHCPLLPSGALHS